MPDKALFIGHSLVGPVMPVMFNNFMADQGLDLRADAQVINGAPLRWNWDNGASAEGVNARDVLPGGDYAAVIVTEAIPLDDQIMWNDTYGYAKRFFDLATSANANTQFFIYETWHYIGDDTNAWRAEIAADLSTWEGIADYVNDNAAPGTPEALIVPAGQALGNLHDAIEAGNVPGLSSIRDLFSDDIHLNETGSWFIAALQAEVVAGVDAANLPLETFSAFNQAFDGPDAALAQAMNTVIDATLSAYARDGVGTDTPNAPSVPASAPAPTPPAPIEEEAPMPDTGDATNNTLVGDNSANLLQGFAGDDMLTGGQGNDTLDGGADWDTAFFSGNQDNYILTFSPTGTQITDRRADGNGTDSIIDVEQLTFGGNSGVNLTQLEGTAQLSTSQMEALVELYIAYFNRAPDAFGLNFWGNAFAEGLSLPEIAALFIDQEETRNTYPESMSTTEIVTAVYNNVLGRDGDDDGFAFWRDALDSGEVSRDQFIISVLAGAKAAPPADASASFITQQALDQQYLEDKTGIGAYFAVHLGMSNVPQAITAMQAFDGTQNGIDQAVSLIEGYHDGATSEGSGTFLMQVVGVLDDPTFG